MRTIANLYGLLDDTKDERKHYQENSTDECWVSPLGTKFTYHKHGHLSVRKELDWRKRINEVDWQRVKI